MYVFFLLFFVAAWSYLARVFFISILESSTPSLAAAAVTAPTYLEAVVSKVLIGYLKFLEDKVSPVK